VDGKVVRAGNPDSAALFAVGPDGLALGGGRDYAFAHLDRRPRPEMAALARGDSGACFAVTTCAYSDTDPVGGRLWLVDRHGQSLPGWPIYLPWIATTPPVIAGSFPNATIFVGCRDGAVYGYSLGGVMVAAFQRPGAPSVVGRLAVAAGPANSQRVGAAWADGVIGAYLWTPSGASARATGSGPPEPDWARVVASEVGAGFTPDLLWIPFDGAQRLATAAAASAAGSGEVCGAGVPVLVVHHADRLWAFCPDGTPLAGWGHSFGDTLVAGLGAGDPDGDGLPEVLTQSIHSGLAFVNRTGYPSPGWPKRGTTEDLRTGSAPLALDVDGDARSEIVGMNASGIVAALRADGRVPEGWPLASGSGATGSPVAADLDRDGTLDLVVPDRFGQLFAYSLPVAPGDPIATSWTMLGGDAGRSSALAALATAPAPLPAAGPLTRGSLKAYPNPARRHPVSFAFRLTEPADVEFRILDTSGHEVTSFSRPGLQGENVQVWDPAGLPAGLYLARLRFRGTTSETVGVLQLGVLR
jgi:hypothetical protein